MLNERKLYMILQAYTLTAWQRKAGNVSVLNQSYRCNVCIYGVCRYTQWGKVFEPLPIKFGHLQRNVWSIIVIVGVF